MIKVYIRDSVGENVGLLGEFPAEEIYQLPGLFQSFSTFTAIKEGNATFLSAQFIVDENGTHFEIVVQ